MKNSSIRLIPILAACATASPGPHVATPVPTPPTHSMKFAEPWHRDALETSQASDFVRDLTDTAGPRLAGTAGDKLGRDWALAAMRRVGLSNVREESVRFRRWRRGKETGEIIAPVFQKVSLTALGGSPGTRGSLDAEVIEFEGLHAIDKALPAQVSGKIVFFNQQMQRTRDGSGYGKTVAIRGSGPLQAAKLGAVGVVIRSVGTDSNRLPHTGATRHPESGPSIPSAALSVPDADLLHRLISGGKAVRFRMDLDCAWEGEFESANVVGDLSGTDKVEQIVLLGAHLDSWDLGTGAIDDGAGVGIALEVARILGGMPTRPQRTLRIVLFANEENGLSGARAYAHQHKAETSRHVAALEADSGTGRAYAFRYLGAPSGREFLKVVSAQLEALDVKFAETRAHGGADLSPLRELGVPVLDIQQDASFYFDIHHTANDTFDKIDPKALAQVSASYAILVDRLLNGDYDFGRAPPSLLSERL